MKKNKQAFTLTELLAVIVILTVILIITTLVTMNIIENARKGAFKNTAYGIMKATESEIASNILKGEQVSVTYTYENGIESSVPEGHKLNYKGERPQTGKIVVNNKGNIGISIHNGKWCAVKSFDEVEVTLYEISEENCMQNVVLATIELLGQAIERISINTSYVDQGVIATSINDELITNIQKSIKYNGQQIENVDVSRLGTYEITYMAEYEGYKASVKRKVIVEDITPPELTIPANITLTVEEVIGFDFMKGVSVLDDSLEEIKVILSSDIIPYPGEYTVVYSAKDSSGNETTKTRYITVIDTGYPEITILGNNPVTVNAGTSYTDAGATAYDGVDGNITNKIITTGTVNINIVGTYIIKYTVSDNSGNSTNVTRTVNVVDRTAPIINAYAGSMLYKDPTFISGDNNIKVYNNSANGNVSVTRKAISGIPGGSGYGMEVKTIGVATPSHGGFYFGTQTEANKTYVTKILAKIPVGYNIVFASNATGTGTTRTWLTPTAGTGSFEEYVIRVIAGSSGTFSSTNYFYLSGGAIPTTSNPLIWQVGYATTLEVGKWDTTYSIITHAKDEHSLVNDYRVMRSSTTVASKVFSPKKQENSEIISNLTTNGTYTIYVKDTNGNETSASVVINNIDRTVPVVSGITTGVSNLTTTGFTITRSGNASDAHSGLAITPYIYQTSTNGSTWTTVCTNNTTSCAVTGLNDNTTYYYRICANDSLGNQACTASKTTKTVEALKFDSLSLGSYVSLQKTNGTWITFRKADSEVRRILVNSYIGNSTWGGATTMGDAFRGEFKATEVYHSNVSLPVKAYEGWGGTLTTLSLTSIMGYNELVRYVNSTSSTSDWRRNTGSIYWTSSPAYDDGWRVNANGSLSCCIATANIYGVRPGLVLRKNLYVISGNGTSTNPYRLSENL